MQKGSKEYRAEGIPGVYAGSKDSELWDAEARNGAAVE